MKRLALLAGAALLCAAAGEKPPTMPLRDVDVTYHIAARAQGQPPRTQRMRWMVSAGKLRVDPPSPDLFMIMDMPAKRMWIVRPAERAVLDLPAADPGLPRTQDQTFQRGGSETVAGLACTDWNAKDYMGRPTMLCLTDDGVMLRASQGDFVLVEAASVHYGPQDPAAFTLPDDYHHVNGPAH